MKTSPKVGDYVALKKPHVVKYPIGVVKSIELRPFPVGKNFDGVSPVYVVDIPTDDPKSARCDTIPVWRQATGLKKSSYKRYMNQLFLRMLEL